MIDLLNIKKFFLNATLKTNYLNSIYFFFIINFLKLKKNKIIDKNIFKIYIYYLKDINIF